MKKNKKRIDPRYFLNETVVPEAAEMVNMSPEQIDRRVYKSAQADGLQNTSEQDHELIKVSSPRARIIDPLNYAQVSNATQTRDPNVIIPLGTNQEHVYFKTADDVYMRLPLSNRRYFY
tara:strand:+ start:320 stop:676 length:357 start_codon:yes stop_codon:yes gene_type:complete